MNTMIEVNPCEVDGLIEAIKELKTEINELKK